MKEVLGIWLGTGESFKFWLGVLNRLKNRGVEDILISSTDGLSGFADAINAAFPETDTQRCIIHQIRNSTRYVSWKDLKAFTADLKPVYKAVSEDAALAALAEFEAKWGDKYPLAIRSWHAHWTSLPRCSNIPLKSDVLFIPQMPLRILTGNCRKSLKTKALSSPTMR